MELILIIVAVGAGCATLTLILALIGIVIIEWAADHVAALKRWMRSFRPRHRLPTGGPLIA